MKTTSIAVISFIIGAYLGIAIANHLRYEEATRANAGRWITNEHTGVIRFEYFKR